MARGRPSKYRDKHCEEVIECLGEGHSITAFAGRIGVHRSTVFDWMNAHEEFAEAVKVGQAKAVEVWEDVLIKVAREGGGNATAAIFGLKNRASDDWSDTVVNSHVGPDGGPVQVEELSDMEAARRIAFVLAKAAKEGEAK